MGIADAFSGLKGFAGAFAIETFFEMWQGEIIARFQGYLSGINPDMLKQMVKERVLPPFPENTFDNLREYKAVLDRITPQRFFDVLTKARPDLAEAIADMGDEGIQYILGLQQYIYEQVNTVSEKPALAPPPVPTNETPAAPAEPPAAPMPGTFGFRVIKENAPLPPVAAPPTPVTEQVEEITFKAAKKPLSSVVKITCDQCGNSWPVRREDVPSIKECIFCHAPAA